MVDLDELDRLHAALPELEPQTIYVGTRPCSARSHAGCTTVRRRTADTAHARRRPWVGSLSASDCAWHHSGGREGPGTGGLSGRGGTTRKAEGCPEDACSFAHLQTIDIATVDLWPVAIDVRNGAIHDSFTAQRRATEGARP